MNSHFFYIVFSFQQNKRYPNGPNYEFGAKFNFYKNFRQITCCKIYLVKYTLSGTRVCQTQVPISLVI